MNIKTKTKGLLNKVPYIKQLQQELSGLQQKFVFPPGHFYSPLVSYEDIKTRQDEIWNAGGDLIEGIDLRVKEQLNLIHVLSSYYSELPFVDDMQNELRYFFKNSFFTYTDAIILYSMVRHFMPKRIIEVGSGFSSAVMLDTNEIFFQNKILLTFIEPYPDRLYSLLKDGDKQNTTIVEATVQQVPVNAFGELEEGDFLFIDSSHVIKTGSDVNHILFKILPVLKPGVLIHFHDVFFPFEYPKEWVLKGFNWNEDYFLRAFMMYNTKFEILLFSDYLHKRHREIFAEMPLCYENYGGSFWIMKV